MKTIKTKLLTMAVLLCSISASAYDFEVDGIYYNISSMEELTVGVTSGDNEYSGDVVVPETVTYKGKILAVQGIEEEAFYQCSNLKSVTISNGVAYIGNSAFRYCSNLTSITIPSSVTTFGRSTFYKCKSLTSVHITDLKSWCEIEFGDYPLRYASLFLNGEKIKDLVIPNGVTSINDYAFDGCKSLTSITIPNTVKSIGSSAFSGCLNVEKLYLEDGKNMLYLSNNYSSEIYDSSITGLFSSCPLKTLYLGRNLYYYTDEIFGFSPFYSQKKLESLIIGDSVTYIGDNLFANCVNLVDLVIPNSVTEIRNKAFENCSSLTNITIPNTINKISNSALKGCINIVDMKIESGSTDLILTYDDYLRASGGIGSSRYYYYTLYEGCSLKNLYLGRNLDYYTNLPDEGYNEDILMDFYSADSLKNITIGCYVKVIDCISFRSHLDSITIGTTIPPTVNSYFNNSSYINTVVKVPEGSLEAYQAADVWKNFWDIQEDPAGIKETVLDAENTNSPIYNLQGVQMKESRENLPAGIYIQSGKKMIVR